MPKSIVLKQGARGGPVKVFQRALNKRRDARGLAPIVVDGILGRETWDAWEETYIALGGKPGTFAGGVTRALRRYTYVRFPGTRGALARRRAKAWAKTHHAGPAAALKFGRRYLGKTESPAGSNTAPWGLGTWIRQLLGLHEGVYWCGVYVWACLRAAGVTGLTSRCASVSLTYDDALAGRNGWLKVVDDHDGQPGDAVGLFSRSTHIAVIERRVPGGYRTLEGNTSSGPGGSQNNGGGVYRRTRSYSDVAYVARPRY